MCVCVCVCVCHAPEASTQLRSDTLVTWSAECSEVVHITLASALRHGDMMVHLPKLALRGGFEQRLLAVVLQRREGRVGQERRAEWAGYTHDPLIQRVRVQPAQLAHALLQLEQLPADCSRARLEPVPEQRGMSV